MTLSRAIALLSLTSLLGGCLTWQPDVRKKDFGKTLVGASTSALSITFTNASQKSLRLAEPLITGDTAVFSIDDQTKNKTHAPGTGGPVNAKFSPAEAKTYEIKHRAIGQAVDATGAPSPGDPFTTKTVRWVGEGVYQVVRDIIIDSPGNGAALDFGEVEIGTSATQTVNITLPASANSMAAVLRRMRRLHEPPAVFGTPPQATLTAPGPGGGRYTGTVTITFTPTDTTEVVDFVEYGNYVGIFAITLKGKGKKAEPQ